MYTRDHSCCGAVELVGINADNFTIKNYLLTYVDQTHLVSLSRGKAFVTFCYAWDVGKKTGRRSRRQGMARLKAWKKFIETNGLGDVTLMPKSSYNPNYRKKVRIMAGLWVPDNKMIRAFVHHKKWRTVGNERHGGIEWVAPIDYRGLI